tara:strand:- start:851 stop:1756 length:906 start_codon:yes stop_codon:yes gene_type:complete
MNFLNKKKIIYIIVSYFLVYYLLKLNYKKIIDFDFDINFQVILLLILLKIFSISLVSFRWSLLNSFLKLNLVFNNSFKQIIFGQFFSIFLPSTIAIDYFKINGLRSFNKKINLSSALGVDFLDRIVGVTGFVTLNAFFVSFFFVKDLVIFYKLIFIILLAIYVLFLILIIKLIFKYSKKVIKLKSEIQLFDKKKIASLFFLSLGAHFFDTTALLLVFNIFFDLPLINQLSLISVSQFSQLIAVTPSALGVTETAFVYVFDLFKINTNKIEAFDISFTVRIVNYILITVLTVFIFLIPRLKR